MISPRPGWSGGFCVVDAWTLDAHTPERLLLANPFAHAGIDCLATRNAPALIRHPEAASTL